MLNLTTTSHVVRVVTGSAVTTDVHASYVDVPTPFTTSSSATPDDQETAISTAATTTVVSAPGSNTVRNVKFLTIRNTHASSSNTITVQKYDGSTAYELFKVTLLAGYMIVFNEGTWFVYDTSGGVLGASGTTAVWPGTNDFRLSGVSGTSVMTADSTSLSTVYLAQHSGNRIALYDGTNWQLRQPSSEISLAVTGRTTDLPFDVFAYDNAGTVTLEFLDWSTATARATGLTRQDGVWVKSGAATRRYLGSIRARSATTFHWVTAGSDAPCKFDLFNADNRIDFGARLIATTNTWNYTTATWRQAQASTNYQVDVMVGLQEEYFFGDLRVSSRNSTISIPRHVGIGYDSTTAFTGITAATANTVASIESDSVASIAHQPAIGRHYYSWLEISTASGTCTWVGDDGASRLQSGMTCLWTC